MSATNIETNIIFAMSGVRGSDLVRWEGGTRRVVVGGAAVAPSIKRGYAKH